MFADDVSHMDSSHKRDLVIIYAQQGIQSMLNSSKDNEMGHARIEDQCASILQP